MPVVVCKVKRTALIATAFMFHICRIFLVLSADFFHIPACEEARTVGETSASTATDQATIENASSRHSQETPDVSPSASAACASASSKSAKSDVDVTFDAPKNAPLFAIDCEMVSLLKL